MGVKLSKSDCNCIIGMIIGGIIYSLGPCVVIGPIVGLAYLITGLVSRNKENLRSAGYWFASTIPIFGTCWVMANYESD
jgi:hypothetical protein